MERETSDTTVQDFLDGLEDRVAKESGPPWIAYGPRFAREKGAGKPPESLTDPVWSPKTRWIERAEAGLEAGRPGPFLLLYAPDTQGND